MRELAQTVGGEVWAQPLTGDVIVGVAAALKKAKLKLGAALLNDLKLWHVEEGHAVPERMIRLFGLVKKSVERGMGPAGAQAEPHSDAYVGGGARVREGEVLCARLRLGHCLDAVMRRAFEMQVEAHQDLAAEKTVLLTIPVSKMDQNKMGVKRTLVCCGQATCSRSCAWWRIKGIMKDQSAEDYIFVKNEVKEVKPDLMVGAWKNMSSPGIRQGGLGR